MKLAIAQMVLGVLIVGIGAVGLFRVNASEPLTYVGSHSVLLLTLYSCVGISVTLGLAVLGCGIAQFLKARG